jgi:hypothetical protein
MHEYFGDAVVRGYEPLLPTMTNHEKDRHVLAPQSRRKRN